MAGSPLLDCRSVGKSFGAVRAVHDVSLTIDPGEVLGLVGPNGAGKTTLVDLIGGEQRPDTGSIVVGGLPLTGPPSQRAQRNGLARTFQHPQVAPDMSARENMLVGVAARSMGTLGGMLRQLVLGMAGAGNALLNREVDRVADALGLQDIDRPCKDMTLGELRLLEVGRALLVRPRLMLLDEPFAGSDARGVAGIKAAIHEILKSGCGVILVDHNVDIVASLAHRIALLNLGSKVFDGSPRDCLASPEMQAVYFGEDHTLPAGEPA
jgi:branched-chain amino acid transport system ATP-binding protein